MKTIIKNISLLLCVVAALVSCHRKPIYDECICSSTLSIPIDIDWETSGISLKNVTILFYDAEDGTLQYEHYYEHNDNDIQSYVSLPEGSYTAVVFNELREDQPANYMSCEDHENISTLRFDILEATPLRSRATTRSYTEQPNDLAVAIVEGIEVTQAMILEAASSSDDGDTKSLSTATKATVESLMGVTTVKKNTTINISAHFDNIFYARITTSPGALVDLVNLSDGYYVYGDQNSSSTSTVQFVMSELEYDTGSLYNGTVSGSVSTFGTLSDRTSTSGHDESTPVTLDILFMLIDASPSTEIGYDMDVTDQIVHTTLSDGSIVMTIDVDFEEMIPAVEPDGSDGDSALSTEVLDWNVVNVPLTQ